MRANPNSDKIVQQTKIQKLEFIFEKLDSDHDGWISSEKIDLKAIQANLVRIMKPLLEELEMLNEPLNKEEFIDACSRLYDTLNTQDKAVIMRFGRLERSNSRPGSCTFKPNLQKKAPVVKRPNSSQKVVANNV